MKNIRFYNEYETKGLHHEDFNPLREKLNVKMSSVIHTLLNKLGVDPITLTKGDAVDLHRGKTLGRRFNGKFQFEGPEEVDNQKVNTLHRLQGLLQERTNGMLPLLSDISSFEIKLGAYNPLLITSGLQTRSGSTKFVVGNRNNRANRYLLYQYGRLQRLQRKPEHFWKLALQLIIFSNSYLVALLHYKNKNMFRQMSASKYNKIVDRVNLLRGKCDNKAMLKKIRKFEVSDSSQKIQQSYHFKQPEHSITAVMSHYMDYRRAYLPKGTTYRPLGVPTIAWRVYNSMLLLPLTHFYEISNNQHGFVPRRGTLTAWKELLTKIITSRNILEIDFQGFFPTISSTGVTKVMQKHSTPIWIISFYRELNNSKPKQS